MPYISSGRRSSGHRAYGHRAYGHRAATAGAVGACLAVLATTALPGSAGAAVPAGSTVGGSRLATHGVAANRAHGVPKPPKVRAHSYMIVDADNNTVLAAKDPHGHYRPASTLKMLTSATLIPKLDAKRRIKPSWDACNVEGSRVGIVTKWRYSIADLFRGMLMVSGNDAAIALAQANKGGLHATLREMNATAHAMHADDTVAKTPNGLDRKGQHTSAYDLALFTRRDITYPSFRAYNGKVSYKFPAPPTKKQRKHHHKRGGYMIYNHDRLLTTYHGMFVGKNGYTTKANATFVGAAKRHGHTVLITLMNDKPNFWPDAKAMLNWGFRAYGHVKPVGTLVQAGHSDPKPSPSRQAAGGAIAHSSGSSMPIIAPIALGALIVLAAVGYFVTRARRRDTWFS